MLLLCVIGKEGKENTPIIIIVVVGHGRIELVKKLVTKLLIKLLIKLRKKLVKKLVKKLIKKLLNTISCFINARISFNPFE